MDDDVLERAMVVRLSLEPVNRGLNGSYLGVKCYLAVADGLEPWAMAGPVPLSSVVISQPKPADLRREPPVQAWQVTEGVGFRLPIHNVRSRGVGVLDSTCCPSRIRSPLFVAAANHFEVRCRPESSSGCGGKSARLGVSSEMARTAVRSRSCLRSRAVPLGGRLPRVWRLHPRPC